MPYCCIDMFLIFLSGTITGMRFYLYLKTKILSAKLKTSDVCRKHKDPGWVFQLLRSLMAIAVAGTLSLLFWFPQTPPYRMMQGGLAKVS